MPIYSQGLTQVKPRKHTSWDKLPKQTHASTRKQFQFLYETVAQHTTGQLLFFWNLGWISSKGQWMILIGIFLDFHRCRKALCCAARTRPIAHTKKVWLTATRKLLYLPWNSVAQSHDLKCVSPSQNFWRVVLLWSAWPKNARARAYEDAQLL